MADVTLRIATPEDRTFYFRVYASTRADEMTLVDWTPEQKEAFLRMQFELREQQYRAEYPDAITETIVYNDVPAGSMITQKTTDAIILVDIALLAEFRRSGTGTTILHNLQKEGKKIILHVLRQNPAAHLYSRLGFVSVAENAMYQRMEWDSR